MCIPGLEPRRHPAVWLALLLSLGICLAPALRADEQEAERSYAGAVKLFQGGWYDRAEKELGAFRAAFPNSTNRNQALLLQAQSRFELKDFEGVIGLIQAGLATAGPQTDQYLSWLADAQSRLDRFEAAAKTYADLLRLYSTSSLALEASYGEAFARFKLGDTARTVELLRAPTSAFQLAAKGSTNEMVLVRGNFLLAEALFAQKIFPAAEEALTELARRGLGPDAEWQRQYLLARIELSDRRGDAALTRVTNLIAMAKSRDNAVLQARSLSLKGEILEEKQPDAAAQAYADITQIPDLTAEQKRQALLKMVDLAVTQNRLTNAIEQLTSFLEQNPQDPATDLLRFSLGEIYLKQFYATKPATNNNTGGGRLALATNLFRARSQFDRVIQTLTNSSYVGKAQLNRGWCYLEESQLLGDPSKLLESQKDFQSAITRLEKSIDQAQARFKLADGYFQLMDYTNALAQYNLLLDQYADLPDAREKLLDHASYQAVRAGIDSGNLAGAQISLDRMLRDFPNSPWIDHALFAFGQAASAAGQISRAQDAFADLLRRFPQSPLVPEVRLAAARACVRQADWAAAIQRYDDWLTQFTNHPARAQAEFDRAWCFYQSGNQTNAFVLFTNLVQQFPSSPPAPLAHLWIGDYYLNQRDYRNAEKYYQLLSLSTNVVPAELSKQALLMAAKAAFFRQGYSDARSYLTQLVVEVDSHIGPEAWFILGDIELEDRSRDATNKLAKFEQAINRFQRVTRYTGNRLVPLAQGKIANCHFQLAAQDTNRYEMATNQFWLVINSPQADVATRSQAEVGLGEVLVRMAEHRSNRGELLNTALAHFLNVVYGRRLHPQEEPDPFWLSRAALAAGTLATETLQRFDEAERLYLSMLQTLPSMRADWERKLDALRQQRLK